MPCDVIVAGAGPAGSLCAAILARAGARVTLFDRARFPRAKLCGDTLNPGAMRTLVPLGVTAAIADRALPLDGMVLTGPRVAVRGTYGPGVHGHAITRRDLDQLLVARAVDAGVQFHEDAAVLAPLTTATGAVAGVRLKARDGRTLEERASFVIAADGRESRLARAFNLSRHPVRPRRWAIGAYFQNVEVNPRYGEMHVRHGHYIGVAPVPGDLANVCLVVPHQRGDSGWRDAAALLRETLRADPALAGRFTRAVMIDRPRVLGPMSVDTDMPGVPGMLLAGDAAGFIDPITGDGLRLALESAPLTAAVVSGVLEGAIDRHAAPAVLAHRRRVAFHRKWQFNRAVRSLVATPAAVAGAAFVARVAPPIFSRIIRYAGDAE